MQILSNPEILLQDYMISMINMIHANPVHPEILLQDYMIFRIDM
jgi:hypothetical protein